MARKKDGKPRVLVADAMTKSGHCAFPSTVGDSHAFCTREGCTCDCHSGDPENDN